MRWGSCPGSSLAGLGPGAQCCSLPFRHSFKAGSAPTNYSISGGRLKSRKADDMDLRGLLAADTFTAADTCGNTVI